jgi:4-hydroxybenzoate polyprenyltransferase
MKTEVSAESGKSALALIGAATASLTLNQWVAMATGVYVVVQIAYLIRKWIREERDWHETR